jgi:hypothetical protein
MDEVENARDKTHLVKIIDKIGDLTEVIGENDAIDALCYIITVVEDRAIRSYALSLIDKIKGR